MHALVDALDDTGNGSESGGHDLKTNTEDH